MYTKEEQLKRTAKPKQKTCKKCGEHTLGNLVVCCNVCNLKKHAKDPIVFANMNGKLL